MHRRLMIHGPTVVWGLTILVLTSIPTLRPPDLSIEFSDKLAHAAVYAVFACLLIRSFKHITTDTKGALYRTFVFGAVFGAIDEIHQRFIPGRYAEWTDYAADLLGIGLVVLVYFFWSRNRQAKD